MDNSNNTTANQPIQPGQAPEKDNLKTAVIIIAVIAGLALLFGFFCVTTLFKIGWDYLWEQRDSWSDNSYEIDGKSPSQYMLDYVGERYNDECLYVHDKASDSIDELPSIIDDSQTNISFYAACKNIDNGEEILISGYDLDKDYRTIYDDYLTAKYLPETKEYYQKAATEAGFSDRTIVDGKRASLDDLTPLDANAAFDDLLKQEGCQFEAAYYIPRSEQPTLPEMEALTNYYRRNVASYSVSVYLVNDDVFNDRTKWSIKGNMEKLFTSVSDLAESNNS